MFPNFIQLLKLVTIMENWIPLPAPPFGESAISSVLMQLEFQTLHSSGSQVLDGYTKFLEAKASMLHNQVTAGKQWYNDTNEFLELIERHRPLRDYENDIREAMIQVAEAFEKMEEEVKQAEQAVFWVKNRHGSKKEEGEMDISGATNISDAIGGTDSLELMIL